MQIKERKQFIKFITLSIVVHLILLFVITKYVGNSHFEIATTKTTPRIIQAQLINKKESIKPVEVNFELENDPNSSLKELGLREIIKKDKVPKQISTPETKKIVSEQTITSEISQTNNKVENVDVLPNAISQPNLPVSRAKIKAASKKYLSKWQDSISFDQAFSNGSKSVVAIKNKAVAVPQYNNSTDNTGSIGAPRVSKVICDNTLNTAAVVMSGLFGGTVQCKPSPDLRAFLKNRDKKKNSK